MESVFTTSTMSETSSTPPKSPGGRRAYSVEKPLGEGSFGTVFLVKHKVTGERLVMKEVRLAGLNKRQLLRSRDEVQVLKRLDHPHLIGYIDAFLEDVVCTLYIMMEFAEGGDLETQIKQRARNESPFPEADVQRLLVQSVDALAYCHHTLKLLHRDVKPANIFLSGEGDVKLGDFGISRSLATSKAVAMTRCGSPLYMSPEICRGAPYDRGADCWSLACTFYHAMSLREPWADHSKGGMMGLIRAICNEHVDLARVRQIYSAPLCDLLEQMLSKDSKVRPSMREVAAMPWLQEAVRSASKKAAISAAASASAASPLRLQTMLDIAATTDSSASALDTDRLLSMGTESHAAASVLQRTFQSRRRTSSTASEAARTLTWSDGGTAGNVTESAAWARCLSCWQAPRDSGLYDSLSLTGSFEPPELSHSPSSQAPNLSDSLSNSFKATY
jgi:NIMA (never in mitosis gene a)-related kinase